jgi:hypothetical protein
MSEHPKRFSLRHGFEAAPEQPIFDDAPKRLRFFVLEFLIQKGDPPALPGWQ